MKATLLAIGSVVVLAVITLAWRGGGFMDVKVREVRSQHTGDQVSASDSPSGPMGSPDHVSPAAGEAGRQPGPEVGTEAGDAGARHGRKSQPEALAGAQAGGAAGRERNGKADGHEEAVKPADEVAGEVQVGFRLAEDARLPAAAMPLDFEISPVAEKALKAIVDDYYRDLASSLSADLETVREGGNPEGLSLEKSENGETTLVVPNGDIAEEARKRADFRFKALFGNAAYNRLTMQSALERRLPASLPPAGK